MQLLFLFLFIFLVSSSSSPCTCPYFHSRALGIGAVVCWLFHCPLGLAGVGAFWRYAVYAGRWPLAAGAMGAHSRAEHMGYGHVTCFLIYESPPNFTGATTMRILYALFGSFVRNQPSSWTCTCVCRASSANQNATQGYGLVEFGRSRVPRAEFF